MIKKIILEKILGIKNLIIISKRVSLGKSLVIIKKIEKIILKIKNQ